MTSSKEQCSGYIFMCNGKTKPDCYRYRVFGLPASRLEVVKKIKPHTKLFLFDFDLKLLYGIYIATSHGKLQIEPLAFGGKFSAQVRFETFKDCLPLPESAFKDVIKDNYSGRSKFRQDLTAEQVDNLVSIFRPTNIAPILKDVLPSKTTLSAVEKTGEEPNALTKSMACLHPSVNSMRHVVPEQEHSLFCSEKSSQVYSSDNSVLTKRARNGSEAVLSSDGGRNVRQSALAIDSHWHEAAVSSINGLAQPHTSFRYPAPPRAHVSTRSKSMTAAYWVAVASEDPNQADPSHNLMPLECKGQKGEHIPVSSAEEVVNDDSENISDLALVNDYNHSSANKESDAPCTQTAPPELQASSSWWQTAPPQSRAVPSLLHATPQLQAEFSQTQTAAAYATSLMPSSSVDAAIWPSVASEETKQLYSNPLVKESSTGNIPVSFPGAAVGYETMSYNWPYAYTCHQNVVASEHCNPSLANFQVPSHAPVTWQGSGSWPYTRETAAYWTTVASQDPYQRYAPPLSSGYVYINNQSQAPSVVNATLNSDTQAQLLAPAALHSAAYMPSTLEAESSWKVATTEDGNQVYYNAYKTLPQ